MTDAHGYTLREAAGEIGASVPWVRKQIRTGKIAPPMMLGKYGEEYRLSPADLQALAGLYPRTVAGGVRHTALSRYADMERDLSQALAGMAAAEARADERAKALEREQARADRLETSLQVEREKREAMQRMGFIDYLRGRHRNV